MLVSHLIKADCASPVKANFLNFHVFPRPDPEKSNIPSVFRLRFSSIKSIYLNKMSKKARFRVPFRAPGGAIPCRLLPKAKQAGQALRRAPHKIPHKSPALPDFYTSARAAAARPRPPCGREGGITPGFSGTGGVSRGDSVPPGHFNAPTASCHYPSPHRTPHGTARADPAHPACRASRPTGRARSFRARA